MRFLYKINSGYDGFTPSKINAFLNNDGELQLGWQRYLDSVESGDECWVYFIGPHRFSPGVYVKGIVNLIDRDNGLVFLRILESSSTVPLTDQPTNARIGEVTSIRYRQVFLWPDHWNVPTNCSSQSCANRLCENCGNWRSFPSVNPEHFKPPAAILASAIRPAFWLIPTRCYLYREYKQPSQQTIRVTHMFGEFKLGEKSYAYPFARGMYDALVRHGDIGFDVIVPIPLSPEKAAAGELHRTLLLANELGRLLGIPVREYLTLNSPISKRRMMALGYTPNDFAAQYWQALRVDPGIISVQRVLLVDDVITKGTTLSCAINKLRTVKAVDVVVTTAGQMILKSSVSDERSFRT